MRLITSHEKSELHNLKNLDLDISFKSRPVISYHLNDYILKELRVASAVFSVLNYKSRFRREKDQS
jgi:hypothetical protein